MSEYITLPKRCKDITGQRFGRWIALGPIRCKRNRISWRCRCDCGNEKAIVYSVLVRGNSNSCGCLQKELTSRRSSTHGMTNHPMYATWTTMTNRCHNESNPEYDRYGGRGIRVIDEWRLSFHIFVDYVSRLPGYLDVDKTLDRIDNDKGYMPGNVRWADAKAQMRNTRRNNTISYKGETLCLEEWAERTGIPADTLRHRIGKMGWSQQKAIETPKRKMSPRKNRN